MLACRKIDVAFPACPKSAPQLRRTLRDFLDGLRFENRCIDDVLLAAGEAAGNAIEHAYRGTDGTVELHAAHSADNLVIEVCDRGCWRLDGDPERGRGLGIMRALVDRVSIENTRAGTIVRLEVRLSKA